MTSDRPPETVRAYLEQLRRAFKGAPSGLVADALADTEDHLNNEIANNPELTEAQILASVIDTYGTPEEIAEEYRDMEATIAGPFPRNEPTPDSRRFGFFNVFSDPRTYGALLYMLLSVVTGTFYFAWTIFGLTLTICFAILIFGVPFALLFIGSVRVLALVEGRIVEGLLGVRMPRRLPSTTPQDTGILARIRDALADIRTWSSLFYLLLMLPLGIVYFVIGVTGISVSLAFIGAALYALVTNDASHIRFDGVPWLAHLMHTAPGLVLLILVGLLLLFVVLHIARGIGWLHARIAEVLLVRP